MESYDGATRPFSINSLITVTTARGYERKFMSYASFSGSSSFGTAPQFPGHSGHITSQVSGTQQGPVSFSNGVSLDDLVSGHRSEFHDLIGHHAATASAHKEGGATGRQQGQDQKLPDLLKKVLEDGVITPQEIVQLQQAISDNGQGAGSGGTTSTGTHHCCHGGRTGGGAGTAPTGTDDHPGADDPAPVPTPVVAPPAVIAPVAAPTAPASGSFKLGNTNVTLHGGTDSERAKTRKLFEEMYQKDAPFKKGIDSKSASGLDVTIEDLPANIEGQAAVGGNTMSLDPQYIGNTNDYANTIAHEFAHNLGMQHGAPLEAFAAEAAAVTA